MLASVAPVLIASLVFVAAVTASVLVAVAMVWRGFRRRMWALRRHTAVRSAAALWSATRPGVRATGRAGGALSTARLRHELWRGVGSAERSVQQAEAAGGSVGELPAMCRRLHTVALDLDHLLAMGDGLERSLPEREGAHGQAADIIRASTSIRVAALAAANDVAGPRVRALAADADREVRCLAAGIARAHSLFTPGG